MKPRRLAVLAALLVVAAAAALTLLQPGGGGGPGGGRRALIIDSLYEWVPNDELLNFLVDALSKAGYEVKVIKGADATVDAFRNITLYDVVIMRTHGGYLKPGDTLGGVTLEDYAPVVFTGEPFSECLPLSCKYYLERLSEEVVAGEFRMGGEEVRVFALTPLFFRKLKGEFRRGAVVILASCYGLSGRLLADALLDKGASYFISWDWKVSPHQMDEGLSLLIEEAVVNGVEWGEAVELVSNKLGPDPWGGGVLKAVKR